MIDNFKVGDKVLIKKSSEYYGQSRAVGEIRDVGPDYYEVAFEDGYFNTYTDKDLQDATITSWKDRMEATK